MRPYQKLVNYVDAATNLAESMAQDLKAGDQYSNETVVLLSEFINNAHIVKDMLETIADNNMKLN